MLSSPLSEKLPEDKVTMQVRLLKEKENISVEGVWRGGTGLRSGRCAGKEWRLGFLT